MLPRFFCESLPASPDESSGGDARATCPLGPEESRHARKVLRLSVGQRVELFDGRGQLATAAIAAIEREVVTCRVLEVQRVPPTRPWLTVASAVPKGPRAAEMVNQLGQVGVDEWVPLRCAGRWSIRWGRPRRKAAAGRRDDTNAPRWPPPSSRADRR